MRSRRCAGCGRRGGAVRVWDGSFCESRLETLSRMHAGPASRLVPPHGTLAPSHSPLRRRTVAPSYRSQCPTHYLLHIRKPPVALLFYLASCARDRNRPQVRLQTKGIEGDQTVGGGS